MPYDSSTADAVNILEDEMLTLMWDATHEPGWGFGLKFFEPMHREVARGVLRAMAAAGKVEFVKGLWTEDGHMAGAGYSITHATSIEMRDLDIANRLDELVHRPKDPRCKQCRPEMLTGELDPSCHGACTSYAQIEDAAQDGPLGPEPIVGGYDDPPF